MPKKARIDGAASAAALIAVPEGKVVDFTRGRLLPDTPEEYVRQNVAMSFVLEYGYDRPQIEVEFKIKVGSGTKRIDLAVFPDGVPQRQESVALIIENRNQG